MNRTELRLETLSAALARLSDALQVPRDQPLAVDGTIQRFEFAYELFWKTLKARLLDDGLDAGTPREALRGALAAGWLDDQALALRMLQARNLTSHTYDQDLADQVYQLIPEFLDLMQRTTSRLAP